MQFPHPMPPKSRDSWQSKYEYQEFYRKWPTIKLYQKTKRNSGLSCFHKISSQVYMLLARTGGSKHQTSWKNTSSLSQKIQSNLTSKYHNCLKKTQKALNISYSLPIPPSCCHFPSPQEKQHTHANCHPELIWKLDEDP